MARINNYCVNTYNRPFRSSTSSHSDRTCKTPLQPFGLSAINTSRDTGTVRPLSPLITDNICILRSDYNPLYSLGKCYPAACTEVTKSFRRRTRLDACTRDLSALTATFFQIAPSCGKFENLMSSRIVSFQKRGNFRTGVSGSGDDVFDLCGFRSYEKKGP